MWRLGFEPCSPGWKSKTTTATLLLLLLQEAVAGLLVLTIGGGCWCENGTAASEHDGDYRSMGHRRGCGIRRRGQACTRSGCGRRVLAVPEHELVLASGAVHNGERATRAGRVCARVQMQAGLRVRRASDREHVGTGEIVCTCSSKTCTTKNYRDRRSTESTGKIESKQRLR